MIKFSIGGKTINPDSLEDALMAMVLNNIREQISEKIGNIRDPETGAFPTVIVRGDDLDSLRIHVEGAPQLIELVKQRLQIEDVDGKDMAEVAPKIFLSYTSDDLDKARQIAEALNAAGIEVWWDRWCISAGDSLRQKIDEGIGGCTHFLVLLTPQSITKPWVNQEMDGALVRKLNDKCKFMPLRLGLDASSLPPLLSGMLSPSVDSAENISQLINDIYGVTRKPPKGMAPDIVQSKSHKQTGYSAAASTVARWFVEKSEHALFADPQIDVEALAKEVELSFEDTEDALDELSDFLKVTHDHVLIEGTLFAAFDEYWKQWRPPDDALKLAADIMNDPNFPADCSEIAKRYGWEARRLNPAISYLFERGLIIDYGALGTAPWAMVRIVGKTKEIRRFVKSRSS